MSFDDKQKRLSAVAQMPPISRVDHRLHLDKDGNHPLSKLPRSQRRRLAAKAKKLGAKYNSLKTMIKRSGAGFPVDKLLRELAIEYTHRFATSGTYTQPISFNYFESFCNIRLIKNSTAPYAEPTSEFDHLFNLTDYFDYITSDESDRKSVV